MLLPPWNRVCFSTVLVLLAACGNGHDQSSSTPNGSAPLNGTLAYVVSTCGQTATGWDVRETLRIQRGENAPVDVTGFVASGTSDGCLAAHYRIYDSERFGAFERLAVSPDGTRVAFEVNDNFSLTVHDALDAETEGFFVVNADGTGLQRLGPQSREPAFFVTNGAYYVVEDFKFTPDGRAVVFVDKGPGPADEEATQIVLLDLATGERRFLTRLPVAVPAPDLPAGLPPVGLLTFLDDTTLGFVSFANPDGLNPSGENAAFKVPTDGSLRIEGLPAAEAVPGGTIDPHFLITGPQPSAGIVLLAGDPDGPPTKPYLLGIQELFLRDGDNLLQLTNFRRADTFTLGRLGNHGTTAYFTASVDREENPSNNCQLFAIDRTGADLRQLTHFSEAPASLNGCTIFFPKPGGCYVEFVSEDRTSGTLVFLSTCDPVGANPNGAQLFAIRADGSGLRQLTSFAGVNAAGNSAEGPGLYSFSG